jgi:hypothetical protein
MTERAFAGGIMNGGFQQVPRAVQLQRLTTASASDELIDEDFEAGLEEQNIDNQDIVVDQEEPTETGVNRTNIRTTMNGLNVQDGNGVQIIDYEDISP